VQYSILLSRSEDTKAVEGQEQSRFIKSVLEALEVPIEYDPDEPLTIEMRQKLRQSFKEFNIHVINDMDGGLKISVGDDLIAEWYKSTYKLKQDLSQKDPQDRLYLEMTVNFWTVFEDFEKEDGSEMQQ
jgi:hypothetical protein